jgi:hypothetical protein
MIVSLYTTCLEIMFKIMNLKENFVFSFFFYKIKSVSIFFYIYFEFPKFCTYPTTYE